MSVLLQGIGVMGTGVILLTYFLVQVGRLDVNRLAYSLLNLLGAMAIVLSLLDAFNLPSLILELTWAMISLYGIYRVLRARP